MNRVTNRQTNTRETGQRRQRWLWFTLLSAAAFVAIVYLSLTQFKPQIKTIVYDLINDYTDLHSVTTDDIEAYIGQQKISQTTAANATSPISGPLTVHPTNPRYFADGNGQTVYLTGSHYWLNLQDGVLTDPPPTFDYSTYLDFLEAHNHNFFRLWTWEQSKWVVEWASPYYFDPMPYSRTGPGNALDGKPKYDLTQFNQIYFDRLRQHVIEAGDRGMYVSVMLFNGWSTDYPKGSYGLANPWQGHPFHALNNVNGIDGDPNGDESGDETHTLAISNVTALQEAYVKKVVDTLNDLDNVLYEISNESHGASESWQYHMIDFIKQYEAGKLKQHPVGMTVEWPSGDNADLFNSPADWISPNGYADPPPNDGSKVIVADTDHIWGIGGDRQWVWKSFMRGLNPIFMDQYDDSYKLDGGGYDISNANDVSLRRNLGYTRSFAERIDLAAMTPRGDLCSTDYCLANASGSDAEYLVYAPNGGNITVDLAVAVGELTVEWFNPESGESMAGSSTTGGENRTFAAPFGGDAVLHLFQSNQSLTVELFLPVLGNGNVSAIPQGPYHDGQEIRLAATPDPGWAFVNWSGGLSGSTNPETLAISSDTTVTATFALLPPTDEYTVTMGIVGEGAVDIEPSGPYTVGQVVLLTALPAEEWAFADWNGGLSGSANPETLAISRDTIVTATFALLPPADEYTMTMEIVGEGIVDIEPSGPYTVGQVVLLTALPAEEWAFEQWNGDLSGAYNPALLTITGSAAISATFEPLSASHEYTLITTSVGNGQVDVQPSSPYVSGAVVTTTAIPDTGWEFAGWSGVLSGSANPASLMIEADTAVTATFEAKSQGASGPLRVDATNPRYFTDGNGQIVYLTGSHTWSNLQDTGGSDPPTGFDYQGYLDFLGQHNHNFFRMWMWEQAKWGPWLSEDIYFAPPIYERVGPGTALDGKPKSDLTRFNQAYFDRLRARVIAAGERGIYASIMLFDGWSVEDKSYGGANPWPGHPYHRDNNVNGIDGDANNDGQGHEVHTMEIAAITALQEAYVRKVIDTVNDLDNVLYEISNESHGGSDAWQSHMVTFIKGYEAGKEKQHPVGITVEWPNGDNAELFDGPADWISPNNYHDAPASDGRKVIITDTDHIWGIGGDRQWVWKSFVRGLNPIFMDPYDCSPVWPPDGCDPANDVWVSLRKNMGYTRIYAQRMNLAAMTPRNELCSSEYCLANPAANDAEYLVYLPDGGTVSVDLTSTAGEVQVEWFNPETGQSTSGGSVAADENRTFTAPFNGDAVLYLYQDEPPVDRPFKLYLPVVGEGNVSAVPVGPYAGGESVLLTASAVDGWQFEAWDGDLVGDENPATLTITSDMTVTARFGPELPVDLFTLFADVEGNGSVLVDPPGPFEAGQLITLTAMPEAGWAFVRWYGEQESVENPTTLRITGNATITAVFHATSLYLPYQLG